MIKIGYFGDGSWASRALSHIAKDKSRFQIAFITPRYDTQDPALKEWASRLGVPFLPSPNVNSEEFLRQLAEFKCDVLVSMSFNQILKTPIINAAPLGFINCHAGALPFYRGRNPLNWALINGEKELGVTVHYVDEGIDTGDILVQKKIPIGPNDDYASLLEKAHVSCADVLIEALTIMDKKKEKARKGAKKQKDIHPVGSYFGRRRAGDEWIEWTLPAQQIHNFIRALNIPGPGARSLSEKGEIALLKSEIITTAPNYGATSGEIVGRNDKGVIVKTGDNTLLITQAAFIENDMPGAGFIPKWPIGTRLGFTPIAEIHRLNKVVEELRAEIETLKAGQDYPVAIKKKG